MTPSEVKALEVSEYLAMLKLMDEDRRQQERAARKRVNRGRHR